MFKSDIQLQPDVMDELRWDPAVGSAEIGIAAKDGVITLSGNVESFAAKYAAVRAAERVRGVRAVADALKVALPSASRRSDTEIAHTVADRLTWDTSIADGDVRARVEEGWVWLEGETEWDYQRRAAEHAMRYLTGVKGVTNLIRLKQGASSLDVRQRIESALKRHAELDAHLISIEAADGKVTLRGKVRSWAEREDAERAAWSAPGVISVDDQLAVGA